MRITRKITRKRDFEIKKIEIEEPKKSEPVPVTVVKPHQVVTPGQVRAMSFMEIMRERPVIPTSTVIAAVDSSEFARSFSNAQSIARETIVGHTIVRRVPNVRIIEEATILDPHLLHFYNQMRITNVEVIPDHATMLHRIVLQGSIGHNNIEYEIVAEHRDVQCIMDNGEVTDIVITDPRDISYKVEAT